MEKIERNEAVLADYRRYEHLLLRAGLSEEYVHSYLYRGGFSSWEDFYRARLDQESANRVSGTAVGAILGLGMGMLLYSALKPA